MNAVRFARRPQLARALALLGCSLFLLLACGRRDEAAAPAVDEAAIAQQAQENIFEEILRKLKADPDNPDLLYHLGDLYDRHGQYDKAVATFTRVVALKPDLGYAHFKLGTAYSRLNQPEPAIKALTRAAALLPDNPVVLNNLGIAYGKQERWDEEIAALQKAVAIRPRYAAARFNLALTYLKKGNQAGARAEYQALNEFDATLAAELLPRLEGAK